MKTIDLSTGQHNLAEILTLARSEELLLYSQSGDYFVVERADDFDREVAALGSSAQFMSFLENRSKESEDMSLRSVREKRGL